MTFSSVVILAGCSGPPRSDEGTVDRAQALETSTLAVFAGISPTAFVSFPMTTSAHFVNNDRLNPTSNVTLTLTVSGSFTPGAFGSGPSPLPFPCTLDTSTPGTATVRCHTDQILNFGAVRFDIIPTAPGPITVVATVEAAGVPPATDTRQGLVAAADSADVSIWGYADNTAFVGQEAHGSFFASNSGPLDATGVHVTFQLNGPGGFTFVATPPWSAVQTNCSVGPTTADCAATGALPRAFSTILFDVGFTPTGAGNVSITAAISATERDPIPENNSVQTFTFAVQPMYADLAIAMTAAPPSVVGKPLKYALTVTNRGPDAAADAFVDDFLPPGMTFVSASPSQGSCYGGEWGFLSCDLGGLAAGASANIALTVLPTAAATATNTASVSDGIPGDIDTNYDNNTASTTVTVHGRANLNDHPPPTRGGCGLWPGAPIDNLDDGNTLLTLGQKPVGGWFVTSDGSGFQTPSSVDGLVVPGGPGPSKYMVQSSGIGFQIWGAALGIGWPCPYDVSRYRGVRFAVKAGGQRFFFVEIPTAELQGVENGGQCTSGCFDFYRLPVSLPDDGWYECTVAFADLAQAGFGMYAPFDVGAVMGVQFNLEVPDAPYDLSLDNVEFVASPNLHSGCGRIGR